MIKRDYLLTRSYKLALILDLFYGLATLAIYYFISATLEQQPVSGLHGAPDYFAFVSVGVAIAVVTSAASAGFAFRVREEQVTGTLETLIAQPAREAELVVGIAGFPFLFSLLRASIYLAIAIMWAGIDRSGIDPIGTVAMLTLAGTMLSTFGIALGSIVFVIRRGEVIVGVGIFASEIIGGAFFPQEQFPPWLEAIAEWVPTRFIFDGLREALFEGSGWEGEALVLAVLTIVTFPLAVWLCRVGIRTAARKGTLGQF